MIKALLLLTAVVAVVTPTIGADEKPSAPPAPSAPRARSFIERYDKNKDGQLDDAEREAMNADRKKIREAQEKERLKQYDKNGDGKLDDAERAAIREEFLKRREAGGQSNPPGIPAPSKPALPPSPSPVPKK